MTDTLVILAGGISSRMKESSAEGEVSEREAKEADQKPKGLVGLGNEKRPLIDYLLYNAKQAGINNVVILTSPKNRDYFEKLYGNKESGNEFHGLKISYATQHIPEDREKPLGTADAVYQTLDQQEHLQNKQFLVCNSDNLYSVESMQKLIEDSHANALVNYDRDGFEFPKEKVEAFSVTNTDENNFLKDIIEKPQKKDVEKYADEDGVVRVNMNLFKFDGEMIFPYLKNCPIDPERNEKELPTALLNMIDDNPKAVYCVPHKEHIPDLTRKSDIEEVKNYIQQQGTSLDW